MSDAFENLPQGWATASLGDILTLQYGKGLPERKREKTGKIPVYGSSGIVGYHTSYLIKEPSIIVGRKGAVGSVFLSDGPSWPIDTVYYAIPPKGMALKFVSYLLKTLSLSSLDRSTAIPGLNRNDAYAKKVLIPPINEQLRIVGKVEELFSFLDAGIASLRAVQLQLKRYRQAILKHSFQMEGNVNVPFNEVVESYQNGLSKRRSEEGKPIKVLRLADIENGVITAKTPRTIRLTIDEEKKYSLNKTDLLCIRVNGSKSNTGQLVVFTENESWAFCDHLIRIRLRKEIEPQYVKHYFNSQLARKHIESSIISSAGQNTISQGSLAKIPFPLISSSKQKAIIDYIQAGFSIINYSEQILEQTLQRSYSLRQSILNQAFSGKLVSQDPTDEPAEKLLENIRAELFSHKKSKSNGQIELSNYVK